MASTVGRYDGVVVSGSGQRVSAVGGTRATNALAFDPVAEAARQWRAHGWTAAAGGMAAVTSVMRAQQIYLARVEQVLRPHGLTFSRYEVLMVLVFSRTGAMPLSRLGARLQVHPSSLTNAIDRLEAQQLVLRRPHPGDRRTTLAELTEAGRALALAATEDLNGQVFERPGLSGDQSQALVAVLTALREDAGDF